MRITVVLYAYIPGLMDCEDLDNSFSKCANELFYYLLFIGNIMVQSLLKRGDHLLIEVLEKDEFGVFHIVFSISKGGVVIKRTNVIICSVQGSEITLYGLPSNDPDRMSRIIEYLQR